MIWLASIEGLRGFAQLRPPLVAYLQDCDGAFGLIACV
jgi:hypothetical protein